MLVGWLDRIFLFFLSSIMLYYVRLRLRRHHNPFVSKSAVFTLFFLQGYYLTSLASYRKLADLFSNIIMSSLVRIFPDTMSQL